MAVGTEMKEVPEVVFTVLSSHISVAQACRSLWFVSIVHRIGEVLACHYGSFEYAFIGSL